MAENINLLFIQKKALGASKSCRNGKHIEKCFLALPLLIFKLQKVAPGGQHEGIKEAIPLEPIKSLDFNRNRSIFSQVLKLQ